MLCRSWKRATCCGVTVRILTCARVIDGGSSWDRPFVGARGIEPGLFGDDNLSHRVFWRAAARSQTHPQWLQTHPKQKTLGLQSCRVCYVCHLL